MRIGQRAEDRYWTQAALDAEAKALARKERPIPFERVECEIDALKRRGRTSKRRARPHRK